MNQSNLAYAIISNEGEFLEWNCGQFSTNRSRHNARTWESREDAENTLTELRKGPLQEIFKNTRVVRVETQTPLWTTKE